MHLGKTLGERVIEQAYRDYVVRRLITIVLVACAVCTTVALVVLAVKL